ncbi:autotransporter outer membrane beta-barrel domain-containing protein [Escherichia coli]
MLNGGVLDLSDFSTWQSGTSYNDGLEVSGSSGTGYRQSGCGRFCRWRQFAYRRRRKDGVYVVVDASDGQVSLANNNSYLGTTQIASGTLMVSDNSQLGDTHYNRQVIFTDKQQESVMEITANVDTRSTTTEHGRDIEMRADGEVAVDAGVDTQWGALMADSSGQHQDEGSTFTKTGAGTLELTASGTTQSAVRVEEGTLKGDVADTVFPYASSLWVGDGATFVTGGSGYSVYRCSSSSGTIDISDGTVLRLTGQDTSVALNASLFNGDGTLVNATDGVTLTGELSTNLETDSLTYLSDVTVNGNLTNTSGASLQNGVAGDTLTVNGDYTGGGTLLLDSELNGDDSVSDQLVLNGNTAGNTTVVVNSITGIGEPTSTGIKVVDFSRSHAVSKQCEVQSAGSGYVNMGAYDYTLVEITTTGICDRKK